MKALTLTQPWATLVAIGAKRYETRSWATNYRGPLAIHAAANFPSWARQESRLDPFWQVLQDAGYIDWKQLPTGKVVAIGHLSACQRISTHYEDRVVLNSDERAIGTPALLLPAGNEEYFGDYAPNRYAWQLEWMQKLETPIPAKGSLGLWEWVGMPDREMTAKYGNTVLSDRMEAQR